MFFSQFWSIKEIPNLGFLKNRKNKQQRTTLRSIQRSQTALIVVAFDQCSKWQRQKELEQKETLHHVKQCRPSLPTAQWASGEPPLPVLHSFKVLTSDQKSPVKDQEKKMTAKDHLALQNEHVRLGQILLGRKKKNEQCRAVGAWLPRGDARKNTGIAVGTASLRGGSSHQ